MTICVQCNKHKLKAFEMGDDLDICTFCRLENIAMKGLGMDN